MGQAAIQENASPAERLITATVDLLGMALDDHPPGVTDMDIVGFVQDQLDQEASVTEQAWIYSSTEAFTATALGLLQTLRALEE